MQTSDKKREINTPIKIAAIVAPFIIGLVGFLKAGCSINQACYNALGLYFMVRDSGAHINVWISFAQYMAPLVLLAGFFILLFRLYKVISDWFLCLRHSDVVAVYGDNDEAVELASDTTHGTFREQKLLKGADKHVIMFSSELKSIDFYKQNLPDLSKKKTFVMLRDMDVNMINTSVNAGGDDDTANTVFFNTNEMIARAFWKDEEIIDYFIEKKDTDIDIAILGFNSLGKKLLYYGLLDNIYHANQHITYHVWGDSELFQSAHSDLKEQILDGDISDSINYYGMDPLSKKDVLKKADIIILCEEDNIAYAETVINLCWDSDHIFWNSSRRTGYDSVLSSKNLKSFGKCNFDLSIDNIEREATYKMARALDRKFGEATQRFYWNENNYFRESNILATDYHYIRERILDRSQNEPIDEAYIDELCRLEHVRWKRFHYYNYWEYGETKDSDKRTHFNLVPYDSLPKEEQVKNAEIIIALLELYEDQEDSCLNNDRRKELIDSLKGMEGNE